MKKGFTLVEMLIVVVVVVTLMSITFKLGSINKSSSRKNETVAKLQKLENCLSGYFAAFGSYPPVQLLGSRNPYLKVSDHGIQNIDGEENKDIWGWDADTFRRGTGQTAEVEAWDQVEAACKAQPVGCSFPFPENYGDLVEAYSDQMKETSKDESGLSEARKRVFQQGFDDGVSKNLGRHTKGRNKTEWREIQLFKFGLMSYLLPRFLVMMNSDESLYEDYAQWTGNNVMPCDALDGSEFSSWGQLRNKVINGDSNPRDLARVANVPSQAACARWMPNLERIVNTPHSVSVFGVDLQDTYHSSFSVWSTEVYSPGGYDEDSTANQYVLDYCTVRDGWGNEFYYYSPAPYQTYMIWSAGPNGRTFPAWISREELDSKANQCIGAWIEDDIRSLSH